MRKLSASWVPRLLTVDQKRVRMNISNALLVQIRRNKSEFWRRLITVDETWIHHYTPEIFFVKWRGNHICEQLFCGEKHRVLFVRVTDMGASLGEVCRVTRRLCWKKLLKKCLVSLLGRKLFRPFSYNESLHVISSINWIVWHSFEHNTWE